MSATTRELERLAELAIANFYKLRDEQVQVLACDHVEAPASEVTVIFVRAETPRYFAGWLKSGRTTWAHSESQAARIPQNNVIATGERLHDALPVWGLA
jgi:hypothetical protein